MGYYRAQLLCRTRHLGDERCPPSLQVFTPVGVVFEPHQDVVPGDKPNVRGAIAAAAKRKQVGLRSVQVLERTAKAVPCANSVGTLLALRQDTLACGHLDAHDVDVGQGAAH